MSIREAMGFAGRVKKDEDFTIRQELPVNASCAESPHPAQERLPTIIEKLEAQKAAEVLEMHRWAQRANASERMIMYAKMHPDFEEYFKAISAKLETHP